jgi:hypothetical protein
MHRAAPSRRGRRRLVAVLALAASTLGAAAATPASAMEIATQDDSVVLHQHYGNRARALDQMKALGVRWLRINVIWSEYKRYQRQFRRSNGWQPYDDAVNLARAKGIKVQFTIIGTPDYDRRGDKWLTYYKPKASRFKIFARNVARHFQGRVFRISIWNEFNLGRFLSPQRQAVTLYRALYKAGYAAIKGVDRRIEVLIGETTSSKNPLGMLQAVATTRGGLRTDGVAHHAFQFFIRPGARDRRYWGISNIPAIRRWQRTLARRKLLRTPRGGTPPLLITEYGYQRRGIYRISEAKRRSWALLSFQYARRTGAKQLLWYQISHQPTVFSRGDVWDSGIIDLRGRGDTVYNHLYKNRRTYGVR